MKITVDENYGADADGNRGIRQEFYELEDTEEERQEIAEILYEAFASGCGLTGGATIEYEGIEIEVEIEDYHQELKKMLVEDMDMDYDSVRYIANELDDIEVLVKWLRNFLRDDMKSFGIFVTSREWNIEISSDVPIIDRLHKLGIKASSMPLVLSQNKSNYNYQIRGEIKC